jgi:hypothetical protein
MEKTETMRRLRRSAAFFMLNEEVLPRISGVPANGSDGRKVLCAELVSFVSVLQLLLTRLKCYFGFLVGKEQKVFGFLYVNKQS